MTRCSDVIQKLRTLLPAEAISVDESYRTGTVLSARVPADSLRKTAGLFDSAGYYLESITGLDFLDTAELVYHFNCYEPRSRIALRVLCTFEQPPATVSDIFQSALWLEREVHEFFGIAFGNHPDLRPLLLPEDADYHPLRKTFGIVAAYRERHEVYGKDQ